MDHKIVLPEDPSSLPCPMVKFFCLTDDVTVVFIIEDKYSEPLLRESLKDLPKEDLDQIVDLVNSYYSEEEVGQTELSKVTTVAEIQRILPS